MPNENATLRMQAADPNSNGESNNALNNSEEFYKRSFSSVLMNNIGIYVTCEFLIGTGALVEKTGVLYGAGVNFVTLYDDELERYITCDLYSLKFVTFYDTRPGIRTAPSPQSGQNSNYPSSRATGFRE